MDHIAVQFRRRTVFRKQGHLSRGVLVLIEHIDGSAPSRFLRVVDLPEVEHLALHHTPVGNPAVLDNTPITVLFAVFDSLLGT